MAQLEFHHIHCLCSSWCFLRPTWLHTPGCLALREWITIVVIQVTETFFVHFLCILDTSSQSLLPVLNLYCFCPLSCLSWQEIFLWCLQFSWRALQSSLFYFFPLFLCIINWRNLSYVSLLFFGTLHSVGYTFPSLPCFSLLFFPQLFVKLPQTITLPFCIFSFGMILSTASHTMLWTSVQSSSGTLSTISSPLNLFLTSTSTVTFV